MGEVASARFFEVKLDLFSGPIDLLLHLVKQNELPIEKLSLAEIATQYMETLECMRQLDLEIAAEYLVIATTLLSIKASVLLNEPVELVMDDEGNLVDPHEELLRRLRDAQVYRAGAAELAGRKLLGVDVFANPSSLSLYDSPPVQLRDHDPILLGKAFQKLLLRTGNEAQLMTISFENISIVERMMGVLANLKKFGGRVVFYKLVPDISDRGSLIVSFIALLELCKRSLIRVEQSAVNEEIMIVAVDASANSMPAEPLSSEFDDDQKVSANG